MISKTFWRAGVWILKFYTVLIVLIVVLSFTSRKLKLHEKTSLWQLDPNVTVLGHRIPTRSELVRHKKIVHRLNEPMKKSDRYYFDDNTFAFTAEDALNTVEFEHPSDLTSRVTSAYKFLSSERVGTGGPIRILSWTIKYFRPPGAWYPEGDEAFSACELEPWMQCEYTHNRNYYNYSEAILFHGQRIFDLPHYRLSNQKWIFWEVESPQTTWHENPDLDGFGHIFNLTSTYALDSTVPIPYIHTCTSKHTKMKPEEHPNYAKGKRGRVAWLSFSCHTSSQREEFVRELQRYIPVDVYGFCGPMSCQKYRTDDCLKNIIQKKYKFYLSLEESFCSHLLSPNIWKIYNLRLQVIPIVLGAANYSDYYPEGTFIDAKKFSSVQNLAKYLLFLDKHDQRYNQFIIKRGKLVCSYTTNYNNYLCQLCRHLHNFRRQKERVGDVSQYWNVEGRCQEASDFYRQHFKPKGKPWWKQNVHV